eukprot:3445792-Lingulodinium_polyedra.AAC.1
MRSSPWWAGRRTRAGSLSRPAERRSMMTSRSVCLCVWPLCPGDTISFRIRAASTMTTCRIASRARLGS